MAKVVAEDERAAGLARERAHAEQEQVSNRLSMSSIGDMPDSSDDEEEGGEGGGEPEPEPEGEVVWEGVRDGQML